MNLRDPDYFPQLHGRGAKPLPGRCGASAVQSLRAVHALDATICHGIFGSGDKNQSTLNQQTGASEDAQLISGAGSVAGKDDAVTLGGSFNTNTVNTGLITGAGGRTVLGGVGGDNSGTINMGFGAVEVGKLLSDATSGISAVVAKQTDASSQNVNGVLAGLQDLALSKQTNGESARDKTILWIVALVVAVLAVFGIGGKRG